ncbi:hypothetical protein CVIRNUC_010264 [Coccomyxa viridis]|uniref:Uncharacterized protein n=1 Tax=Coccomyxa viridis TaxID=1274662 RepID=A0AAV1IM47_9CHLO|nr:hypothetical protein CVIRNUC_010264 [Coccomyxa viridis]
MQQSVHSTIYVALPSCGHALPGRRVLRTPLKRPASDQRNSDSTDNSSSPAATERSSDAHRRALPWAITFDIRWRESVWGEQTQERMVKMFAAKELGLDTDMLSYRLRQLTLLLPDMSSRVASMKPALLAEILRDPALVAERCVRLREALPHANVSQMVSLQPGLLLEEVAAVLGNIEKLGELLGVDAKITQSLVTTDPRFVDAEAVEEVLEEMRRLMPQKDPKMVLIRDPSWLLKVERGTKRLGRGCNEE